MIIYDLTCDQNHRFEGWFQSAQDFDSQLARHLISCPRCGSEEVCRIPSAVAIGGHRKPVGQAIPSHGSATGMPSGTHILGLYRQLVEAVKNASEDVGSGFAEEARKIHYDLAPERPIRGETSDEEFEALQEEGITVFRMPDFKDEDLN